MKTKIVLLLLVIGSVLIAQEKPNTNHQLPITIEGYEQFDAVQKIDKDIADYKKGFEQRITEIKYVLGLVGITNEATIQEAISKDATCLRLDTAVRVLEEQKKSFADVKMFKKQEVKGDGAIKGVH